MRRFEDRIVDPFITWPTLARQNIVGGGVMRACLHYDMKRNVNGFLPKGPLVDAYVFPI